MDKLKYIIAIDLGTTNSTVSYCSVTGESSIFQFAIPQLIAQGLQGEEFSLPSFVYLPLTSELDSKIADLDWDKTKTCCIGKFAKERGGTIPDHVISSSKSWLCHSGVNRKAKILPLNHESVKAKISPLEASAKILEHIKESWNYKMDQNLFEDQKIFITVPASFDPDARQLVQEAALMAGFPEITLLEEPQAAFYSWIYNQGDEWRKKLKVGDRILVVDIGGGTTDFSLISVINNEGDLALERVAVGTHLLLGGDNLDLTLAYLVKSKLEEEGHFIEDWQFHALQFACREAKEVLLSENPPQSYDVTIMGRGSSLIGNSLTATIDRKEIEMLILDGFFPKVNYNECSLSEIQSGIQQIGLPFAKDPRVTCQLAKFLSMSGVSNINSIDKESFLMPTAVLYNGGTMKAPALRHRILEVLNHWAAELDTAPVRLLEDENLDFAVSCGAAFYGLVRGGKGVRIKSGTSRSYYIGVEDAVPAVPGLEAPMRAICVVPFGMEEGEEKSIENKYFSLVLGEKAQFRFFSHPTQSLPNGIIPEVGTVIKNWKGELSELSPIETILDREDNDFKTVSVKLNSRVTELGFLELWFQALDGRKWKLEFNIRNF